MIDVYLVPAQTVVAAKGDSEPIDLSPSPNRVFLLTLSVTAVVEQEAIEVQIFTSEDGAAWSAKPVATLSQKFYIGEYPLLVDLSATPGTKFLRAHWEVNRWGRGATTPKFEIALRLREVPQDALREAAAQSPR
jgi:hypothetical protein